MFEAAYLNRVGSTPAIPARHFSERCQITVVEFFACPSAQQHDPTRFD
jgi:hypothetical protein